MAYVYAACAVHENSIGGKFWPVLNFTELQALFPAACFYTLSADQLHSWQQYVNEYFMF